MEGQNTARGFPAESIRVDSDLRGQPAGEGRGQFFPPDGFGEVGVHAGPQAFLPIAGHRIGGKLPCSSRSAAPGSPGDELRPDANPRKRAHSTGAYTASLMLARLKSSTTSGGTMDEPASAPCARDGRPSILVFCSTRTGLSFHRKLVTGSVILPFSTRNTPSRVRPVTCSVCGCKVRMYQSRVTSRPRSTDRKSTRLNSSHLGISYAVFCLKK